MTRIFIDGDACPVKDEVLKVASRHELPVTIVANTWHRIDHYLVEQVVVAEGADAADDVIAERCQNGDVVVTADIPLASRCLEKGGLVIDSRGRAFDPANIGMQLAMRDLMRDLREQGAVTGGPAGFTKQDRSRFLDGLERLVQTARRR